MDLIVDENTPPREVIRLHLSTKGIPVAWLARNLHISRSYMLKMLQGERKMTEKFREQINIILETNY